MYYNAQVKIPENNGKITLNHRGDVTYVEYTYARVYDAKRKFNVPKRTTIGKQCRDDPTLMQPNPNFLKFFPGEEIEEVGFSDEGRCSLLHIGTYVVIKKIIADYGLDKMFSKIIGKDSGLLLDLAAYSIVTEDNAGQYYPDYAYDHPLMTEKMKIYGDSKVSSFFHDITIDQIVSFLNEWNANRDHRERIYISYDSTNKSCEAGDVELAEFGHSKDGGDDPVFNYALAFDHNNREPLFYEQYAGSITDVSQLQYMLQSAKGYGYRKVGFILDRGYFSMGNIRFMDNSGYNFVIMLKGKKDLVSDLVLQTKGTFEEVWDCNIREYRLPGTTVKGKLFPSDEINEKTRYFHIYYSSRKASEERDRLENDLDRMERHLNKQVGKLRQIPKQWEHYFEPIYYHEGQEDQCLIAAKIKSEVVEREIKLQGYFVIVTSEKMTARDALILYKSRDEMEKLFRNDKTFLGDRSMRVYSEESVEGKMFVEFVALIIRNKMYTCLKQAMIEEDNHKNYMTVPGAIKLLEKIEMIRHNDHIYRLDHGVNKMQKEILKAFGLDLNYIKSEAATLSEQLAEYENIREGGII